jgi:hypothetical protein
MNEALWVCVDIVGVEGFRSTTPTTNSSHMLSSLLHETTFTYNVLGQGHCLLSGWLM